MQPASGQNQLKCGIYVYAVILPACTTTEPVGNCQAIESGFLGLTGIASSHVSMID